MINNILEAIGETPLVRLNQVASSIDATIWVKLEYLNPANSVKDRIAAALIEEGERTGELKPGGTIVEATSGNTGAALAMVAAVKGYRCIFVMPDKMSQEKIDRLKAYGARVIITPTNVQPDDPRSYYCVAKRVAAETRNAFLANQYHNATNAEAHYLSTGPEIWRQCRGDLDAFVAGLGTGGTISGVGKYLKEQNKNIGIVGVDPVGSILYDLFYSAPGGGAQPYKVEGIGEDFMPGALDFDYVDEIIRVNDRDSFLMARAIARQEGILVGGSSGSAVCAAITYAEAHPQARNIVVLLADSGLTYLSKCYSDEWMKLNSFLEEADTVESFLKDAPLISATMESRLSEIFEKMKANGVSQIPILDGDRLIGIINDKDLYEFLIASPGEHGKEAIQDIINTDVPTVESQTPIVELQQILTTNNAAVVVDGDGRVLDIVTKVDVINYLLGGNE